VLVCRPRARSGTPKRERDNYRGWHLPGGRVDPGEAGTFDDTGRREFEEEVGVPLPGARAVTRTWQDSRNSWNVVRLCIVEIGWDAWDPPTSSKEMEEIRWLPQADLIAGGSRIRDIASYLARAFLERKS
jgi:8-oxo-dGTP pyrophosphatase MutT (NUDIX family)